MESASVQHAAGVVPIAVLFLKKLELTFPIQRDAPLTLWTGRSPGFLQCAWVSETDVYGKCWLPGNFFFFFSQEISYSLNSRTELTKLFYVDFFC